MADPETPKPGPDAPLSPAEIGDDLPEGEASAIDPGFDDTEVRDGLLDDAPAEREPFVRDDDTFPVELSEPEPISPVPPAAAPRFEPSPAPDRPQPEARTKPPARRSGGGSFFGWVLGGIIAAGAGYGLAQVVPNGWPIAGQAVDLAPLQATIAAQDADLAALKDQIARLSDQAPVVDPALTDRLAKLETALQDQPPSPDVAPLTAQIAELEARLGGLEAAPALEGTGVAPAAIAALQQELSTLKEQIAAQQGSAGAEVAEELKALAAETRAALQEAEAQAVQLKTEAEAAVRSAGLRSAIGRMQAALDSGVSYPAAVAELQALGLEVPASLAEGAAGGLPTLASLQATFPDAARAALDASLRATVGDSGLDRLTGFLRTQTGVRSLVPREGSDPDAVLSRAEANVKAGQLPEAMAEIAALPAEGQAALADWTAAANRRLQAVEAVNALTASADAGN